VRILDLAEDPLPAVYLPLWEHTPEVVFVVVKTDRPIKEMYQVLRTVFTREDKNVPIVSLTSVEALIAESSLGAQSRALLFGTFSGVALVLAIAGTYSTLSNAVSRRTREIGIRMALGASTQGVLRTVLAEGILLSAIGVMIGLAGSWGLTRLLRSQLYEVGPFDPWTFAGAATLLSTVGVIASYIPARRATKVDPVLCLRYE
jgi:ABC-type antimicrobial peptide transport system permease subunit